MGDIIERLIRKLEGTAGSADKSVGMAQGAVTVQLSVERFVSGGGHAGSRLGRADKCVSGRGATVGRPMVTVEAVQW
jgi:hypothetical protein